LIIFGPDEKQKGIVTVKNLETKEQQEASWDDLKDFDW
jgi:histidyl-tRNA synthetase